jgi:hypothetical protein
LNLSVHKPHGLIKYDPEKCADPKCHLCGDNCLTDYVERFPHPGVRLNEETVEAMEKTGLRNSVKMMIGGGQNR